MEGRKFFYYVYQYEASDLLGAWRDSQIYVKWDTKKIDKAYRLSATEVTKDAEGDGYTINMSLVGTPVAPYLKDPSRPRFHCRQPTRMELLWFLSAQRRKILS